jgi:outer membrane protein
MKHPLPWIILSLLLGSGLFFQLMSTKTVLRTAYVTNAKLYSEFEMSKELDKKNQEVQFARKTIMDSLGLKLNQLDQKVATKVATEEEKELFGRMRNEYGLKQQQFTEDNNVLTQQYQEQISNQLNQYLEDFTEEKGYDYIFGATGNGSLMGAKEEYDVTDEVLNYINNRYKGASK